MNSFTWLLCLISLIVVSQSQPNYQSRILYYNETQNVCSFTPQSDIIRLNINLEGSPLIQVDEWGWALCSTYEHLNKNKLSVAITFYYFNQQLGDEILFEQSLIKNTVRGVLVDMEAKVVHSGAVCNLRGRPCSCKIIGDGQRHHFGNQFPNQTPAHINVACKFSDNNSMLQRQ